MRTTSVVLVALLAACENAAIVIVVEPAQSAAGIDEIRLYLGTGGEAVSKPPELLVPEGYLRSTAPRDAVYWTRNRNNELDRVAITGGEAARFVFTPGDSDKLDAVIAVGFAAGRPASFATLFHAEMPSDRVDQYELALHPAADPLLPTNTGGEQLRVWGAERGDTTCVQARSPIATKPDYNNKTLYIVSDRDPDCDGFPTDAAEECRPLYFQGVRGPTELEKHTCLTQAPVADLTGRFEASVLGGEACVDGKGPGEPCGAGAYCVPKSVQAACSDLECASAANVSAAHVACVMRFSTTLGSLCPQPAVLTPGLGRPGITCTGEYRVREAAGTWKDSVVERNGTTFVLEPPTDKCHFKLSPIAGTIIAGPIAMSTMIAVDVTEGRGLALPLRIQVEPVVDCLAAEPASCSLKGQIAPDDLRCVGAAIE